jgi:hypothetical protein
MVVMELVLLPFIERSLLSKRTLSINGVSVCANERESVCVSGGGDNSVHGERLVLYVGVCEQQTLLAGHQLKVFIFTKRISLVESKSLIESYASSRIVIKGPFTTIMILPSKTFLDTLNFINIWNLFDFGIIIFHF